MEYISLYITALTVVSLALLGLVIYLKYKAKYTREKYAFAALFASISLAVLGVSSIVYQTPWAAIIKVIAEYAGITITTIPTQAHWSEQVLIILFLGFIIWMIQRTFNLWDGEISVNQYEQQKRREKVGFVSEGLRECARLPKGEPLKIYNPVDYSQQVSALDIPSNSLGGCPRTTFSKSDMMTPLFC